MEDALQNYTRRQDAVRRKHERMAKGYVTKLNKKTGVYVQVPDNKVPGISLKLMLIAAAIFVGFKVLLLAGLGPQVYESHVAELAKGSRYEQVGAWFMQVDPVTAKLAQVATVVTNS